MKRTTTNFLSHQDLSHNPLKLKARVPTRFSKLFFYISEFNKVSKTILLFPRKWYVFDKNRLELDQTWLCISLSSTEPSPHVPNLTTETTTRCAWPSSTTFTPMASSGTTWPAITRNQPSANSEHHPDLSIKQITLNLIKKYLFAHNFLLFFIGKNKIQYLFCCVENGDWYFEGRFSGTF